MSVSNGGLDELRGLPRDGDGPVFQEPWEAQVFALAVQLESAGWFTWTEWAAALARQINAAQAAGDPDLGDTYYVHWLETFAALCAEKGLVPSGEFTIRTEEWRAAYRRTPHGSPVELKPR